MRCYSLALTFAAAIPNAVFAEDASSKRGAMIAGEYIGTAENCFSAPAKVLSREAYHYANRARKKNPQWYYIAYNTTVKGIIAYDEALCYRLAEGEYGPNGKSSLAVGFRIMNIDNWTE